MQHKRFPKQNKPRHLEKKFRSTNEASRIKLYFMRRQEICYSYELDKTTRWAGHISDDDDSCVVLKSESDKHPREVVLNQVNWEIDELKKRKKEICINDGTEANGPSLHECFIRTDELEILRICIPRQGFNSGKIPCGSFN